MNVALILVCLCCLSPALWASSWHERKRMHKMKSLRTERMRRVAKLSEDGQLDHFKNAILNPFLRVRVPDTDGNQFVQDHIKAQMTGLGWTIQEDTFNDTTPFGIKQFNNIIAIHNPYATRRLTLACHFDSKYFANFDFIGATDSAVPCALLIDLARQLNYSLAKEPLSEITLQLIFFDGEEAFVQWSSTDSIYGARHLADKMEHSFLEVDREVTISQLEAIDLFILLDLIGTEDCAFVSYFNATNKYFERLQKIEMRLGKEGLLEPVQLFQSSRSNKYFTSTVLSYDGGIEDDHIPFLQRNVPVLHLIAHPFPHVWHKQNDDESALHYPTIRNLGKILRNFVVEYIPLNV